MNMFVLVQQTFLIKNIVKSLLIFTLEKVIYYKGTFFQGETKTLLKTGWRPAEKIALFQHASSR
jgi:hypothetical protein